MGLVIEAESYQQRLERLHSYFDHLPVFDERGKYANNDPRNNVQAVRTKPEGRHLVKEWFYGKNIVTNDGDIYYALKAVGGTPATNENFLTGRFELRTGSVTPAKGNTYTNVTTPISGSRQVYDGTYPKVSDGDTDNTAATADTATYRVSYTTGAFNATGILGGAIHDNASPVSATKLLTHFSFAASFDKTASDTLKVFVNHLFDGQ
jgi:hypothetical protein